MSAAAHINYERSMTSFLDNVVSEEDFEDQVYRRKVELLQCTEYGSITEKAIAEAFEGLQPHEAADLKSLMLLKDSESIGRYVQKLVGNHLELMAQIEAQRQINDEIDNACSFCSSPNCACKDNDKDFS